MAWSQFGFFAVSMLVALAGLSVVTPVGGVAILFWILGCLLIAASISLVSRALLNLPALSKAVTSPDGRIETPDGSDAIRQRLDGNRHALLPVMTVSPLIFLMGMLVIRTAALLH